MVAATISEMKLRGYKSEVLCLDTRDSGQVTGIDCPVHKIGPGGKVPGYDLKTHRWIARNAHRFEVAIVHGIWTSISVSGAFACRRAGLPYLLFPHGMLDPYFRRTKPVKHWIKQAFWLIQGPALAHAKAVVFTGEEERELARGEFWGPAYTSKIAHLGVPKPPLKIDASLQKHFRNSFPSIGRSPYILFLSRIHPKKGLDMLIEAFAEVSMDFPDLALVVAGSGDEGFAASLNAAAAATPSAERIHFLGTITGADKWGAISGAEALCLWTHQENFGLVLAEALSAGCPVLTTERTNIAHELRHSGAALIGTDTAESAVATLRSFLSLTVEQKAEMRKAALVTHRDSFSIQGAISEMEELIVWAARPPIRK